VRTRGGLSGFCCQLGGCCGGILLALLTLVPSRAAARTNGLGNPNAAHQHTKHPSQPNANFHHVHGFFVPPLLHIFMLLLLAGSFQMNKIKRVEFVWGFVLFWLRHI
jgi:hypothetical protein